MPSFMIVIAVIVAVTLLVAAGVTLRDRLSRTRTEAAEAAEREARIASDARHGEGGGGAMTASSIRGGGSS